MTIETSPQLDRLIAGYHRFRGSSWSANRARWAELREGQQPEVLIVACSDSRVDPAQIFDAAPGEAFVVRNIAAMVPPFETTPGYHGVSAALEYAVQVLKVKEIVVLGHGKCGGCKAALTQELHGAQPGEGGFIANWIALLDDARTTVAERFGTTGGEAERAMELAGVRASLTNLRTFPFIQRGESDGTLTLRGAFFAIADGQLHVMQAATGDFAAVD